tara:strand:+ start:2848 stop:3750 length:903 start_codon:yes stop_codon:yes gene_type:complete
MNLDKLIDRARASMNMILLIGVFGSVSAINDERQGLSLITELCEGFNANEQLKGDPRLKTTSLQKCIKKSPSSEYSLDELLTINLKDIRHLSCKKQNERCVPLASAKEFTPLGHELLSAEFIDDVLTAQIMADHMDEFFMSEGVADKILELANLLKVSESDTVNTIDEKERGKLQIPIINMSTGVENAVTIFFLILIWPYLYLFSVVRTIGSEIGFITERSGTDWIFFHTDTVSIIFGFTWLISPIIISTFLYLNYSISLMAASFQIASITLFSFFITRQIYKTKTKLYLKFNELSNNVK